MSASEFKSSELPPMPQVVNKIVQIDENNINVSSDQLQRIVSVDPGLTSKILKIANSAFYARSSKVSNLSQAITLLGFKTIKSLTLLVSTSNLFSKNADTKVIQKLLWMRSVLTALITKIIAEKINLPNVEEAFMTGLLKNIGQLIFLNKKPVEYNEIFRAAHMGVNFSLLREEEKKAFEITSPELSARTMEKWNFPEELISVAKLETLALADVKQQSGKIGLVVTLAEILVLIKNISGYATLTDEEEEYYIDLFMHYATELNIDKAMQDYMLEDLEDEIKRDDFYIFCEDLFAS